MPSLDDLKKRISSVKSTQKITKAMKMVAAAKLRRAQESAEKGRPFSDRMNNIILNLAAATIFIAFVIFCVDLTLEILFFRSSKLGMFFYLFCSLNF